MSLTVDFAVLAEGAATDSRGNITLVGVNPNALLTETFPVLFSPILFVALKEDEGAETLTPGRVIAATIRATGPDGEVIFIAPAQRQTILPSPYPALRPKVNIAGVAPFTAAKKGTYTVSAYIAITEADSGAEVAEAQAERTVIVSDLPSLKSRIS